MSDSFITSKTRIRLLIKFFTNISNAGYLRVLATEMNENTNAIRKELNNLSKAGYIVRDASESKVMYLANTAHPLFATLQQLIRKHIGIDSIIVHILERMGEVTRIFVLGDYAQGVDSNSMEIVIEGPDLNQSYIQQLVPKIENETHRKVNIQITPLFLGE
jgi:hypothetical protein